jgi:hypothetical protein
MEDVAFLVLALAFFALCLGLVKLFESLSDAGR